MNDEVLLKLIAGSVSILDEMPPHEGAGPLVSSYNAVLASVKANHPDVLFLQNLKPVERLENKYQLQILFAQLQIILEALREEPRPAQG